MNYKQKEKINKVVYLISLESNTGSDRVLNDLYERLNLVNINVSILNPLNMFYGTIVEYKFYKYIPAKRILANIFLEFYILFLLVKNKDLKITVVSFVYPLWTIVFRILTATNSIKYYYFIPDMMWMKKYVINIKWFIFKYIAFLGAKSATKILVPSASAHLDCISYLPIALHRKIQRLSTPLYKELWTNIIAEEVKDLVGKKYIFHPAGDKPSKNTIRAIAAFNIIGREDLYFVYLKNKNNSIKTKKNKAHTNVLALSEVSDEQIKWIYENTIFVSVVSIEEGVGFPILEANYFKKQIICSCISALPETSNFQAIYVDPFSVESIYNGYLKGLSLNYLVEKSSVKNNDQQHYGSNIEEEIITLFVNEMS